MSAHDEYTADDLAELNKADAASWDTDVSSNPSDIFLLSANLRAAAGAHGAPAASTAAADSYSDLLKGYSLHSLQPTHSSSRPYAPASTTSTSSSTSRADELSSFLSRFESSGLSESLLSGATTFASEYEGFDSVAQDVLKMVDEFDAAGLDDEEGDEVEAANSAASAWGPLPAGYGAAYAQASMQTPVKQQQQQGPTGSPAPLTAPHPTPATPAKGGVMSLAELEQKLKGSPSQHQAPSASEANMGGGLPASLQHLVQGGQTASAAPPGFATPQQTPQKQGPPQQQQQQASPTYSGPPLPQFTPGSPAPPGLSVDSNERQHFYIPLPKSQHNLGFMTKSEIALVFRLQLSQLQSIGDPLSDDFYYQVMQARKGGKVNSSGQAILPVFRSGQARNEDGSPKLPEGTLGRISAFSVHNPKKLMALESEASSDSTAAAADDDQPRKSNLFSSRTLSFLIEEGYRCLMDLEDVDALLASLAPTGHPFEDPVRHYDRQRLMAQRAELCGRLVEALDMEEIRPREVESGEHLIFKFYAVPKGRLLVYRALVLLTPPNTYQLVDVLMRHMQQVALPATPATGTDEKMRLLLSDVLMAMPLLPYANHIFSYFLLPQHQSNLVELIRSNLLCTVLQVMLKKGNDAMTLLQQHPHLPSVPGMPGLHDAVGQWRMVFDGICNSLQGKIAQLFEGLPKDAKPTLPSTAHGRGRRQQQQQHKEKEKKSDSTDEEKKSDEKDSSSSSSSPSTSPLLATRFSMWELMAAFYTHANPDQHAWFNEEVKSLLQAQLQELYGEYRERKIKQKEAQQAQADKEKEKEEQANKQEKEEDKEKAGEDAAAAPSPSPSPPSGRDHRRPAHMHAVPPASSLPPPPTPALRFLSLVLLGEPSSEFQSISQLWQDLQGDYMFYQMKHARVVAHEQARLAQQQQMRQQRQMQQQRQWQQFQHRGNAMPPSAGGAHSHSHPPPAGSPPRGHVPPQHQHFHQPPPQHFQQQGGGGRQGGQHRGGHRQQQGGQQHHSHQQQQQQQQQQSPPAQQQQQQSPPVQPPAPKQPVPVWVKPGTSGANALRTPSKAPQANAGPSSSPNK